MRSNMGALNLRMGIELVEVSAERVVGTMPVEGNTQPYGLLHGGASVVLAETLGSIGAAIHAGPDKLSVGVDINATHHRAARSGTVTGVATPVHLGRTMASYEVVISDEDGKRVCTSPDHLHAGREGPVLGLACSSGTCVRRSERRAARTWPTGRPPSGPRLAGQLGGELAAHDRGRGDPQHRLRAERRAAP